MKGTGGGNFSKVGKIQRDEKGNVLTCPSCGSTHLIKSGTDGGYSSPQRWKCKACGKKTVNPTYSSNYEIENPFTESDWDDVDDLLEHRLKVFQRKEKRETSEEFLNINIKDNKPIGIYIQGDPHVDDDGTDLPSLIKHMDIANDTKGMYTANVGDLQNNWARRTKLEGLWAKQSTTAEEAWALTEWLINYPKELLWIIAGNHDMWSGVGDPVKWMMRPLNTTYAPHNLRIKLKLPKHDVRVNCSHEFRGHSIYNTAHGIVRHAIFNTRDHLLVAGHRHISGYMPVKDANSNITMHCLQVGSYKKYDDYAKQLNLPNKMLSPCACVILNTHVEDTHPDFIKVFWEVEEGADYLTWLRAKK